MDSNLDSADALNGLDWSPWEFVNDQWPSAAGHGQDSENERSHNEHQTRQTKNAGQVHDHSGPPQQPNLYSSDTILEDAQPSTEEYTPLPLDPMLTTIAPQALSRHQQPHAYGFSENTLSDTIDIQWLRSSQQQLEDLPTWFPDQIPDGYTQHTPAFAHQQSIYGDSRSSQAPYFIPFAGSNSADRSQHGRSDLGGAHEGMYHNTDVSSQTPSNGGINLLNSPANFPGAQHAAYTPTQLPERNMYQAYQTQYHIPPQASSPMDLSASPELPPDARGSLSAFSADPTFSPEPQTTRKKGRGRLVPDPITYKDSVECIECGKAFKKSVQPDRCNRCAEKFIRHNATPVEFHLDPTVPNQEVAKQLICKSILARGPPISPADLESIRQREDEYIQRFLDSINQVVPGGIGHHNQPNLTWAQRQQIIFNQKATMDEPYSSEYMTARLRGLFAETLAFHAGTSNPFYGASGDSSGYSENTRIDFDERIEKICGMLKCNKRIVMDVVDGRGVKGFVGHPENYDKRKVSNNDCNLVKKRIMEQGKKETGRGRGQKRKKRSLSPVGEEEEEEGEVENFEEFDSAAVAVVERESDPEYLPESSDGVEYGSGRNRTMEWLRGGRGRGGGRKAAQD
ncbi:hypothetical protein AC579_7196 [Pseudocercospora musae]|uniref:Uncharacterized protein n=1 Tax=Pseudocercospora musae TaxID=113226 RepID=A0A139I444_9PEZI|nr:hypothetical protein AC579_7196 [Pseudocercospora musae]